MTIPGWRQGSSGALFATSSNTIRNEDNVPAGLTYGGQIAYFFHGKIGAEFLADFAPDVGFDSILLADQPHVNSYMGNVIAGLPFGGDRFDTYVSGGFGSIGIRADLFTLADVNGNRATVESNKNRWGGDIGAGVLAYANRFGVRGDVRWFRASSGDNLSNNTLADNAALGADFRCPLLARNPGSRRIAGRSRAQLQQHSGGVLRKAAADTLSRGHQLRLLGTVTSDQTDSNGSSIDSAKHQTRGDQIGDRERASPRERPDRDTLLGHDPAQAFEDGSGRKHRAMYCIHGGSVESG